jgi:hypothetical protein
MSVPVQSKNRESLFIEKWSKGKILDGFQKFFNEYGRYPVAEEIDRYPFLPSCRQIQRKYGGLVKLRQELGLIVSDYGSGSARSNVAQEIGKRGNEGERDMEKLLADYFGECFVHVEKPLHKYFLPTLDIKKRYKQRADFLVYCKSKVICIDVFFARDMATLKRIINIKQKKYSGLIIDTYLVNLNEESNISNEALALHGLRKVKRLEANIRLMNKKQFLDFIQILEPLEIIVS